MRRLFFGLLLLQDLFLFLSLPERLHVPLSNLAIVRLGLHLHHLSIMLFLLFFRPIIVLLDLDGMQRLMCSGAQELRPLAVSKASDLIEFKDFVLFFLLLIFID